MAEEEAQPETIENEQTEAPAADVELSAIDAARAALQSSSGIVAARNAYLDSCKELQKAISGLEDTMVLFAADEGLKGQVFEKTRALIEREINKDGT